MTRKMRDEPGNKGRMILPMVIAAMLAAVVFACLPNADIDDDISIGDATLYNAGDIAVINAMIDSNGLGWTKAVPADGTIVPGDWVGVTWSDAASDKRITDLSVNNKGLTGTLDVTGLTALIGLVCDGNNLTSLDVSNNTALIELWCDDNELTEIDVSNNTALEILVCNRNNLMSLDVSNNTALRGLGCGENELTEIDVSANTALVYLNVEDNNLTSLDVSDLVSLWGLDCNDNMLTSLDLSNNTALEILACNRNNLTSLDLSNNTALIELWCRDNALTLLNVANCTDLVTLMCENNELMSLDLSNNTALELLACNRNNLTSLDVSNNDALTVLHVNDNYFASESDVVKFAGFPGWGGSFVYGSQRTGLSLSFSAVQTGGVSGRETSAGIVIEFNRPVTGLNGSDITVTNVTGDVTKGALTGSGTTWTIALSVTTGGSVTVEIADFGSFDVITTPRTVEVYKDVTVPGTYDTGDVAVINSIIDNNGLDWPKAPADGRYVPDEWDSGVIWNSGRIYVVYLHDQGLTGALDLTGLTALWALYCYDNNLTSLDVTGCVELTDLRCQYNELTELDVSNNTALVYLYCYNNNLTSLNVTGLVALEHLGCGNNELTDLDLTGLVALEHLYCDSNELTELDVSNNTALVYLDCQNNELTDLDVSNNTALEHLYCQNNELTSLDVSNNTALTLLVCDGNGLTSLDVSGCAELETLSCNDNNLTSLDVSENTALVYLYCYGNNLTSLDVSGCAALVYLSCFNNNLTSLDVSGCAELETLGCNDNNLTSLNVTGCIALERLDCYGNNLTSLDVSENTALLYLYCYHNNLTSLDVSENTALVHLYCYGNNLTSLDVSENTALEILCCEGNKLMSLDVSNNTALKFLLCGFNYLTELDVEANDALEMLWVYGNYLSSESDVTVFDGFPGWDDINFIFDHQMPGTLVSFTAVQTGGSNGIADSTGIVIVFGKSVTGLTANDIIITNGTGSVAKGTLTGSGTTWTIALSVAVQGNVTVEIANFGSFVVTTTSQTAAVYKDTRTPVTFTAVQTGGESGAASSTGIVITFSGNVTGLTANDITITNGTGSVTKGTLTGSGTTWTIGLSNVSAEGGVTVSVSDFGTFKVTTAAQTVEVFMGPDIDLILIAAGVAAIVGIIAVAYVFVIRPRSK